MQRKLDRWDLKPEERHKGMIIAYGGFGPGIKGTTGHVRLVEGKWVDVKKLPPKHEGIAVRTKDGMYFDRGFNGYVKNAHHRREIMKARNLVELGNL